MTANTGRHLWRNNKSGLNDATLTIRAPADGVDI
jgi:hypothetical protein